MFHFADKFIMKEDNSLAYVSGLLMKGQTSVQTTDMGAWEWGPGQVVEVTVVHRWWGGEESWSLVLPRCSPGSVGPNRVAPGMWQKTVLRCPSLMGNSSLAHPGACLSQAQDGAGRRPYWLDAIILVSAVELMLLNCGVGEDACDWVTELNWTGTGGWVGPGQKRTSSEQVLIPDDHIFLSFFFFFLKSNHTTCSSVCFGAFLWICASWSWSYASLPFRGPVL